MFKKWQPWTLESQLPRTDLGPEEVKAVKIDTRLVVDRVRMIMGVHQWTARDLCRPQWIAKDSLCHAGNPKATRINDEDPLVQHQDLDMDHQGKTGILTADSVTEVDMEQAQFHQSGTTSDPQDEA